MPESTSLASLGGSFGIMQGRLSPQGREYQSCPVGSWEAEFYSAREIGFRHIEWVVDLHSFEENPLLTDASRIVEVSRSTGVAVLNLTADFLRDRPLSIDKDEGWEELTELLRSMKLADIRVMTVPFVENASLRNLEKRMQAVPMLDQLSEIALSFDIEISIETDLPPAEVRNLIGLVGRNRVGVTFDSGDSASIGNSAREEIRILHENFKVVHIKDRPLGGQSVPLGEGGANLPAILQYLTSGNFQGPVTLQAFRDFDGQEILLKQLKYLENLLDKNGTANE